MFDGLKISSTSRPRQGKAKSDTNLCIDTHDTISKSFDDDASSDNEILFDSQQSPDMTTISGSFQSPLTPFIVDSATFTHKPILLELENEISSICARVQGSVPKSSLCIDERLYSVKIGRLVGTGGDSRIFDCTLTGNVPNIPLPREPLVIKIPLNKYGCRYIEREAQVLSKLNGDTRFLHSYGLYNLSSKEYPRCPKDTQFPSLVLPKMDTDLENFINSLDADEHVEGVFIGKDRWWSLATCLFQGLLSMELSGIVHCDLKTSNILMKGESFSIADFSSARFYYSSPVDKEQRGTLTFTAPELLKLDAEPPSFHTDLFSAGLILLHAATGKEPYSGIHNNTQLMLLAKTGAIWKLLDPESLSRLNEDSNIYKMLHMILVERCQLHQLQSYF
ncbi:Putative protein kinase [Komagataella phaffii CBS 7435]|uniref:Protein kinase domain-containing protein n=2 Tax=Komagataella phaffii TaxID=460519 RepID=C4R8J9_KOMPG|nr:putative protein kinase, overexpression causes sensitivity to staurosporine [Komagataella phaffii GS115]AOA64784.1 GQ67_05041T0 [Komagataella phaffii]CAH2450674.1 Putative protein kinase [Komagataella phaffii CBS 7435]AOA69502.1 GQ68_05022T0 [Komagataella phaffii GS115]CAY71924.1 Predicted protein kinase, overexpression causes sensitivity to staurosporine [Komagataella phaffii GS115]SCV12352.1 Putative protein kinase [Komagataella phaffii CBS 7435]